MNEDEPRFRGSAGLGPTPFPLKGPNLTTTFDTPPHPDAIRLQDAMIRKHLQDRRDQRDRPQG
jgi:hypothetical protein